MLLLQPRQEITKLSQLITLQHYYHHHHTRTERQEYNINDDVGTAMQAEMHQRLFVLSVLMSQSRWSPFVTLLYNRCSFSVCDVLE